MADWPSAHLQRVSALPAAAADGHELIYIADDTNGVDWHLKYNNSEPTNKWRFIGGSALRAEILTDEATTSTSYADLATVGPSITIPLSGDYRIVFGCRSYNNTTGQINLVTLTIAGSDLSSTYDLRQRANVATTIDYESVRHISQALVAGNLCKMRYRVSANTGNFALRFMELVPVRVAS